MSDSFAATKAKIRNYYADISHLTADHAKAERYKERGDLKLKIADLPGARQDYILAAKFQPNDHSAYFKRGVVEYELGHDAAAVDCFQRITADNPAFGSSYFYLGNIALKNRDYPAALQHYNQAVKFCPEDHEKILGSMGHCQYQLKEYKAAWETFNSALRLDRQNPRNYIYRAWCHFQLKEYKAALKDYNQALQLDSENSLLYQQRGLTHLKLKQFAQAAGDFAINLLLEPDNRQTQRWAALVAEKISQGLGPTQPGAQRPAGSPSLGLA